MAQTTPTRNSIADMRAWMARAAAIPGVTVSCLMEHIGYEADGSRTVLYYYADLTVDDGRRRNTETRLSDPTIDPAVIVARLRRETASERRLSAHTRRGQRAADRW